MAFRLVFSAAAERDLALILDHLFDSYCAFGEASGTALDRAATRIRAIRRNAERICKAPDRGTRHDDLLPGLRHLTIERAIFWYDVDDERKLVTVLAVFFGGQDHVRHMLIRLLGP